MNNEDIKKALKDAGIRTPRVITATHIFNGKKYEGKIIVEIVSGDLKKTADVLKEVGYRLERPVGFHGTRRSYLFEKEGN